MSVHYWGESPFGVWTLEIQNEGRYLGKLHNFFPFPSVHKDATSLFSLENLASGHRIFLQSLVEGEAFCLPSIDSLSHQPTLDYEWAVEVPFSCQQILRPWGLHTSCEVDRHQVVGPRQQLVAL